MRALLDTNVVLRASTSGGPASPAVASSLERLTREGVQLCICSQNLVEFWATLTRPVAANGLGNSASEAHAAIQRALSGFTLVDDPDDLLSRWLKLCTTHEVLGRQTFDARLVAVMQGNGIDRLVTLNPIDFRRFAGLVLLTPDQG